MEHAEDESTCRTRGGTRCPRWPPSRRTCSRSRGRAPRTARTSGSARGGRSPGGRSGPRGTRRRRGPATWAGNGCEMPKLWRLLFPLVLAHFWTSDHLSGRSQGIASRKLMLKRRRITPFPPRVVRGARPVTGQEKGDATSLQCGCFRSDIRKKSIYALSSLRGMIARPKMSQNEWKTTEIRPF